MLLPLVPMSCLNHVHILLLGRQCNTHAAVGVAAQSECTRTCVLERGYFELSGIEVVTNPALFQTSLTEGTVSQSINLTHLHVDSALNRKVCCGQLHYSLNTSLRP